MDPSNNIFNGNTGNGNNDNNNNGNGYSGGTLEGGYQPQPFDTSKFSTTTGSNVFNGVGPAGVPGPDSQQFQPNPMQSQMNGGGQPVSQPGQPSEQPFFGFGGGENDSNDHLPQMPQNQGVFTPTQPIMTQNSIGTITPADPMATPKPRPKKSKKPVSPEETIKRFTILSIVLGVGAIVFLFLGIWGLVDAVNTRTRLEESQAKLSSYSSVVKNIEDQTGVSIETIEDVPVYVPSNKYVYITGWDIKLKIPDTLTSISYILNQNADYHSYICFAAVQQGVQYFPAFADISQNRNGIGCLYRIGVSDGAKDSSGNSYGDNIFHSGDYNYFYKAPTALFSASEADKGLETTARDLVKQMITENISTYQ